MPEKLKAGPKLLVVSNLRNTGPLWVMSLQYQLQFNVVMEADPDNTLARWAAEIPDLIIFDVILPNTALTELISKLRAVTAVPILLLTTNNAEEFQVAAYDAGVDEVIPKPLGPSLFLAKVKVWLRRSGSVPVQTLNPLTAGNLQIFPSERVVSIAGGSRMRLTNLELRLLYTLMSQPGRTVTTEVLIEHVWGSSTEGDAVTLKNIIYRLRQKVEADPGNPKIIQTVAGVGYRLDASGQRGGDQAILL